MTEMVQGDQSSSNFASASAPVQSSPVERERIFSQSEVNDLVARGKNEAIERYKREASIASHHTNQTQQYAPNNVQQQQNPPSPTLSEDQIRRLAAEETERLKTEWIQESIRNSQEQEAQRIATEFRAKCEAEKAKIPDFDQVMADINLSTIPYHAQLANMVDNTAEVMYELAKNPSKIGILQNLIDMDIKAGGTPRLALAEMKRLSQSIKDNKQAAQYRSPNEPLSQVRPSTTGADNGRALSVSDYKRKYKV